MDKNNEYRCGLAAQKMSNDRKLYWVLTLVCLLTIVFEIYILLLGAFWVAEDQIP